MLIPDTCQHLVVGVVASLCHSHTVAYCYVCDADTGRLAVIFETGANAGKW